jgi:hypothetical protein
VWLRGGNVFGKVFLHQQTHQKYLFFQLAIQCYGESQLIYHLQQRQFLVTSLPTTTASTEKLSSYAKSMLTHKTNSHYFNITNIHHIFMQCLKTSIVLVIWSHKPFWKTSNAKTVQTSSIHCRALSLSTFYCPSTSSIQSFSNKSFPAIIFTHLPVMHSCTLNYDFIVHAYYQQSKLFLAMIKNCNGDWKIGISQVRLLVLSTTNTNDHYIRTK